MLYYLCYFLSQFFHPFHVVQYLTFRAILSVLTSLAISLFFGPRMILWLQRVQIGQFVRDDGPQSHLSKAGTPTMGGALILFAITVSTLLWSEWNNHYIWIILVALIGFGAIGWVDDYRKVALKNSKGLPARWKYFWQSAIGLLLIFTLYLTANVPAETQLFLPFFKTFVFPLGVLYLFLSYFVIVGTSNAVNLTDGLDGLAIMPVVMVGGALGVFAYVSGNQIFSHYLQMPYIPGVGETIIFCGSLIGAGLGFLWFNTYPAMVFMGDVGALGIGAALGTLAVIIRQEFILFLMGGVFVAETVSVILQVGYFKLTRKRIFKMAPLHHHFELKGWPEPRVIVRFWIITVVLVLLGLSTLKLR